MSSRIIVHKETIDKPGKKVVFQIKIPPDVKAITGVMFGVPLRGETGGLPFNRHSGELRLSIPDKRGVFFSESLRVAGITHWFYSRLGKIGLIESHQWIHMGTKWEFEDMYVPVEQTIIEGYYEDENPIIRGAFYDVNIYLKLEENE